MSNNLMEGIQLSSASNVLAFQELSDFLDYVGSRRVQGVPSPIISRCVRAVRIGEEAAILISPVSGPIVVVTNVLW